jgi:hypothetical protein
MSAKIEVLTMWSLSIAAFVTQNDTIFVMTVIGNAFWIIKNAPGAIKNIIQFKNKVYARMVKKTDEN